MKKRKTLIITLFLIVVIFLTVYAVLPAKNVQYYTYSQNKSVAESLLNIGGAKLHNKFLELTLNEGNVNEILSSIDNLQQYRVVLNDSDADFHIPMTVMKVIKTDIDVKFDVKVENNKLKFTVKESRFGKMNIDNKRVLEYVKDGTYNDINVEKSGNDIYVSCKYLIFEDAKIKNNELFVKTSIDIKGILNSLKNL